MTITLQHIDIHIINMRTRLPFRYGIASMTVVPHALVRVRLEIDGKVNEGVAADHLPPKWFTKDPSTSFEDDIRDMLHVIEHACEEAKHLGSAASIFSFYQQIHERQKQWAATQTKFPPLLWNFGVSLVERAMICAWCISTNTSFAQAVRHNTLGIDLATMHPVLGNHRPIDLLPAQPLRSLIVRHTVGLTDPITDGDIPPDERVNDGLPQSLEASIKQYKLTHLKIKLSGKPEADIARLGNIASVVERHATRFAFTLDGNENFHTVEPFRDLWQTLLADANLKQFLRGLLFVEQPFHRAIALSEDTGKALTQWTARPPIIIDESDGEYESLPTALRCGYIGTSHKNCKGVFHGIANACLVEHRNRDLEEGSTRCMISGEDLANVGPVALLQDMAVAATLGIPHLERNGHHYFRGLSIVPEDIQQTVLAAHGDLYHRLATDLVAMNVHDATINIGSVIDAPFGINFKLDVERFIPLKKWTFASLNG